MKVGSSVKSPLPKKETKVKDDSSEDMKILRVLWHNLFFSSRRTNQVLEIWNKEISINYVMDEMEWNRNWDNQIKSILTISLYTI